MTERLRSVKIAEISHISEGANPVIQSIVGVDPGTRGAIVRVILGHSLRIEYVRIDRLPVTPAALVRQVVAIVDGWRAEGPIVATGCEMPFAFAGEREGGRPQGHMLSYGRRFGHLETALAMAGLDVTLMGPSTWQPRVLARFKGVPAKTLAAHAFDQLFRLPSNAFQHDGVADAALIALSVGVAKEIIHKPAINWAPYAPPSLQEKRHERDRKRAGNDSDPGDGPRIPVHVRAKRAAGRARKSDAEGSVV